MNNPPDNVRTKETRTLLERVDGVLAEWRKFDFGGCLDATELERVVRNIDRAHRQFDSKLFFVVIFGPLKAGKSTLTNALAGEVVSPAGFGKETTRRPSLVIQAKQSGIDQFFSTDAEINDVLSQIEKDPGTAVPKEKKDKAHNAFNRVADVIRGISPQDELQGWIDVVSHPLNEKTLEQTLVEVEGAPRVPLLTVVRSKGGNFLSPGVAIVDMPGLDGARSNWRDNPIHEWVVERAEFFFFVQSSIATFNRETVAFLKDIVGQAKKPPVWAIQNLFDAQRWLSEEKQKLTEKAQREDGTKGIRSLLHQSPRGIVPLNLGMAWYGKNEPSDEWLEKSDFPHFEKDFIKVLHAERASIQEGVCLEKMEQALSGAIRCLTQTKTDIKLIRDTQEQKRERLGAAQGMFDAVNYRSDYESVVRGEICTIAEASTKPWSDSLENEVAKLRERHNRKRAGKLVNAEVANTAVRLAAEGAIKHFALPLLLPLYLKLPGQYCKSAESDAVTCCNQILGELKLPELPAPVPPVGADLPSLPQDSFTNDELGEKTILGFAKTYEGHASSAHIESVAKEWRRQIQTHKEGWVNQLLNDHFSTYCEKRRKHFRAHVQRLMAEFDAAEQPKEAAATATESLIAQMNEALGSLKLPLANAIASMK